MTSGNDDAKKLFFLQEKCDYIFNDSHRVRGALPLLRELISLEPNFWIKLKTQLRICDCLIRQYAPTLKSDSELEVAKSLDIVAAPPRVDVNDIIELAKIHLGNGSHLQTILLFNCACKIYQCDSSPNDAVIGIVECFRKIRESAIAVIGDFDFPETLTALAIRMMKDRLEDMRMLRDVDPEIRTEHEAICMNNIAMVLSAFDEKQEAESLYSQAFKLMMDKFDQNAFKYFICTALLNNLGIARVEENDLDSAERLYVQSLDALRIAENFPNEQQKQEWKRNTEMGLMHVRVRMRKFASKKGRGGG